MARTDHDRSLASLKTSLQNRRPEIEQAVLTRIYAISDPNEAADPNYVEGLRAAVASALDYGLEGIERRGERPPPVPTGLLAQARLAARNAIGLDTVLRRYLAGYTILGDFLVEEGAELLEDSELKRLLRSQAALFDRLLTAVGEEHGREAASRVDSSEQRRAELVLRLLDGELLDASELGYRFDCWHLGLIVAGREASGAVRNFAKALDGRLLAVPRFGDTVWAWLGARRGLDPAELQQLLHPGEPRLAIALGEPAEGLAGWRLTHRQAKAALPIALRKPDPVRYRDVVLLASILQDELLDASLRRLYLEPLEAERDGGGVAKETLRAYFAAGRNASAAAASLGISRRTVTSRLSAIEERLGRPLAGTAADIEAALHLEELGAIESVSRTT